MSAQPADRSHAEPADLGQGERRASIFPAERAERGIELFSRLAGPAIFFLALAGIAWLFIK